ncbi:MAG: hypothetical protein ACI9VR_004242 [Cognaticolwellia sp.]|jgi:hypothetical protein
MLQHRLAAVDFDFLVIATLWSDSQPDGTPDAMKFLERLSFAQKSTYNLVTCRALYGLLRGWKPGAASTRLQGSDGPGCIGTRRAPGRRRHTVQRVVSTHNGRRRSPRWSGAPLAGGDHMGCDADPYGGIRPPYGVPNPSGSCWPAPWRPGRSLGCAALAHGPARLG